MTSEQYNLKEFRAGRLAARQLVEMVTFWQERHGLQADGRAGPSTRVSIDNARRRRPIDQRAEAPALSELTLDDEDWFIGADVVRVPSPRHSPLDADLSKPGAIVWHYTDTDHGTAEVLARRIATVPRSGERKVSWHALVASDGRIFQSIPCLVGAWHAGGVTAKRIPIAGGQRLANRCSVGIELEGRGALPLPPTQVKAAGRVMRAIAGAYGITGRDLVWTHQEIDPTRRVDPGPHWLAALKEMAGLA